MTKFICRKYPFLQIGHSIHFERGEFTAQNEAQAKSCRAFAQRFGIQEMGEEVAAPSLAKADAEADVATTADADLAASLKSKKVAELEVIAHTLGLTVENGMKKADLIKLVCGAQNEA